MFQFFVDADRIGKDTISIIGEDVNHIKNVLRMKPGTQVRISNMEDKDYICELLELKDDEVIAKIVDVDEEGTELPSKVYLFQGLPKADKMETVIQKNVELGVYSIVPVSMKRCVVKLDAKKAKSKKERWQKIAESAAKQSKRMIIPTLDEVKTLKEAVEFAKTLDVILLPYENASGMEKTKEIIGHIKPGQSVGIFIGPEGGFEDEEVSFLENAGAQVISLGKRILRTETAGMALMAVLMYSLEN